MVDNRYCSENITIYCDRINMNRDSNNIGSEGEKCVDNTIMLDNRYRSENGLYKSQLLLYICRDNTLCADIV